MIKETVGTEREGLESMRGEKGGRTKMVARRESNDQWNVYDHGGRASD